MFFGFGGIKLEIRNRKISKKIPKCLEIKQHTSKSPIDQKEKSEGKLKIIFN